MKERLIGAAVLVALAVWLIPWLLSGPDDAAQDGPVSLQLPIPEVQSAAVRTEVIDLDAARRPQSAVIALDAEERAGASRSAAPGSTSAGPAAATSVAADPRPAASPALPVPSPQVSAQQTSSQQNTRSPSAVPPATSAAADAAPASTRTAAASAGSAPAAATTRSVPAPGSGSAALAEPAAQAPQGDWAIQLGSFGDEENARRLAERVTTFGFKPQISDYRAGGRAMYRVRVGPHATRAGAEAAASALSAHGFIAQVVTAD